MNTEGRRLDAQLGLRAAIAVGAVRDGDGSRAARIARALAEVGLQALHLSTTTPRAFETVKVLSAEYPHVIFGIGGVTKASHVEAAVVSGARFIVCPHTDSDLVATAQNQGLAAIPGALTPTEIITARQAGADFVKIFPISAMGGPAYLRMLSGPLPDIGFMASGAVEIDILDDYLAAGAELVELTDALTVDLPQDLEATAVARAENAVRAIMRFKEGVALLTIAVGPREAEVGMKAIRRLPGSEHTRLDALFPGRRGHAVRLRMLLQSAGVPYEGRLRLISLDGFARTIDTQRLYDGGLLHYATDGHPIGKDRGGPLRVYIVNGVDQCDNLKGLCRIETAET
ncbi:MAG: molybdopterin-dependent oxidoreductase [Myxococcota bacterium]